MNNFVQLEIAEYERLKKFEELVKQNVVFTEYSGRDGAYYYSVFNAPEEVKNAVSKLESFKREIQQQLSEKDEYINTMLHEIRVLQNRTLWQRIINKTVC